MPEDANGKMVWDVVALRLASQSANQTSLSGRAKDLLGTATIAGTILGVVLNDKLFNVAKVSYPRAWMALAGLAYVWVAGWAFAALWPRTYSFAPDAHDFANLEQANPSAAQNALYRAMARGYLEPAGADSPDQITQNQKHLQRVELFVRLELLGLAGLVILAIALAFVVANGNPA